MELFGSILRNDLQADTDIDEDIEPDRDISEFKKTEKLVRLTLTESLPSLRTFKTNLGYNPAQKLNLK